MRALLLLVLVLSACTTQPNAAASPTASPTASATATPTPTPTSSPTASPSPIALPSIAQLSAPSSTVVWALVAGTRLFRSSDRGDTWVERSIPPAFGGNVEVSFADDTNGFVLIPGSAATQCQIQTVSLWKTADGAASWQQVAATGIADAMCKSGLASADATHALFTAWSPNAAPVIYRTADSGQTWKASTLLPDPPGFTTQTGGVSLRPSRPRAFALIVLVDAVGGGQGTRYVFRSTDSGATFTYASTVPIVEGSVAFVAVPRWLVIATPSTSKQTVDGGATWQPYPTDYSQAAPVAPDVVFGDATVGYATVRGAIQRTVDSGVHWTTINTPGT
ncbi:MAG: sialidase family protein [Chloroflexota bacterium]